MNVINLNAKFRQLSDNKEKDAIVKIQNSGCVDSAEFILIKYLVITTKALIPHLKFSSVEEGEKLLIPKVISVLSETVKSYDVNGELPFGAKILLTVNRRVNSGEI